MRGVASACGLCIQLQSSAAPYEFRGSAINHKVGWSLDMQSQYRIYIYLGRFIRIKLPHTSSYRMHPKKIARIVAARESDVTRRRVLRPRPIPTLAALTIRVNDSRAIMDVDFATFLGISLLELYKRIGDKLWRFTPSLYCRIAHPYDRGRLDAQPRLAFFRGGAIALTGIVGDGASFRIGVDIAHALRNCRRASPHKQRATKRADNPVLCERYYKARARLYDLPGGKLLSQHA